MNQKKDSIEIDSEDKLKIEKLITNINNRLLTLSENQLKQVGGLCIVAGTLEKMGVIREMLLRSKRGAINIQAISIDEDTAKRILETSDEH